MMMSMASRGGNTMITVVGIIQEDLEEVEGEDRAVEVGVVAEVLQVYL